MSFCGKIIIARSIVLFVVFSNPAESSLVLVSLRSLLSSVVVFISMCAKKLVITHLLLSSASFLYNSYNNVTLFCLCIHFHCNIYWS